MITLMLTKDQIIQSATDYRDDLDFLFNIVDECSSDYDTISDLIEKLYSNLPDYMKEIIADKFNYNK